MKTKLFTNQKEIERAIKAASDFYRKWRKHESSSNSATNKRKPNTTGNRKKS
jgi:hypothetical protein